MSHIETRMTVSETNTKGRHRLIAAFVLLATSTLPGCFAQQPKAGGYSAIAVTDKEVIDAAAFAVKIQQKVMQRALELTATEGAEQQVVAGMNYRLTLKVKVDGVEKDVDAVVWWQPWRKPDPYQLTSWRISASLQP